MKKLLSIILAFVLLVLPLASCKANQTPVDFSVDISKASISVNETAQIVVTGLDDTSALTYSSLNPSVASVSDTGLVTGLTPGVAILEIRLNDAVKTVQVEVKALADEGGDKLSADDVANLLLSGPFTQEINDEGAFGLTDASNVGVIEGEIVEKYKIPADAEFDGEIIVVNDLTLQDVQSVMPNETELTDYNKIQAAIYLAKEKSQTKAVKVKFAGEYNVNVQGIATTHVFQLDGLKNTYFEGNGATIRLNITDLKWYGYFNASNLENVYFHSLKLELSLTPFLTGTVDSADEANKKITLTVDPEFNALCEKLLGNKKSIRSYVEYDAKTKAPRDGGNFVVDGFAGYELKKTDDKYVMEIQFKNGISVPRKGTYTSVQFTQYDNSGFVISSSKDVYIENLTMHHAAGMGVVGNGIENLYINRYNLVLKENSNALMTATADASHFSMISGKFYYTNSLIENSHDDALNLKHGYWYKLDSVSAKDKTFTLTKLTSAMPMPKVGDKISIYNESTFESYNPNSGYYTIESVTEVTGGYQVVVKERPSGSAGWGNARATFISDTPEFVFKNNIIRNKRNRGILVQVPNAIIENNLFENVGHGSIQAATAMDIYNEATMPQATIIRNNKFINNCYIKPEPLYGDVSVFANANNGSVGPAGTLNGIVIENNFFAMSGNSSITLRATADATVKNNMFYETSRTWPSGNIFNCLIDLYNCSGILVEKNYNQNTLDLGLVGISLQGLTTEECVTLTDNTNITLPGNEDAGPVVNVSKLTSTITVDGDLSEWDSANAVDVEFIGASTAEGEEVSLSDIASYFKINKFKLAYNDEGIYFAFDIYDDKLEVKTINDFWLGDCVEILMSSVTNMPNADMQVYKEQGGVVQLALAPTWTSSGYKTLSNVRTNSAYLENENLIQANLVRTENGYKGEVFIPFAFAPDFKTAIDANQPIDIAFIVGDAERSDIKRVQVGNVPHFVESYKTKTAKMPQYIFN